jgi:Ca2+-transporting ATPase
LSLAGVVILQVVVVCWAPAQDIFDTTVLSLTDWLLMILVASTVLLLEELRKLFQRLLSRADSSVDA